MSDDQKNQNKVNEVRKRLAKTIEDFKANIVKNVNHEGPIKGSLRLDGPLESPEESTQGVLGAVIPVFTPLDKERTAIGSGDQVERWVQNETPVIEEKAPYAVIDPQPKTFIRAKGVNAFCAGMDNQINSKVRAYLQKLGVSTYLPQAKGFGRYSIVEQFASSNFNFATVVLSPDAYMFQKSQDPQNALLITDPATVFELGFLVGKLGRTRVAVFYETNDRYKRPTEYFDVLYTAYDDAGQWQEKLLRQMRSCGIEIHENQLA
jgi:hypothetical protein